jgi:uncharacterized protein (DUF302 family)
MTFPESRRSRQGEHLACTDLEDYASSRTTPKGEPMEHSAYGMSVDTPFDMDEADAAVRSALAEEGFGVLTEIDVAATLKAKIGVDRPPYRILGACNPALAHQALEYDEHIGLLLPCNVTLSATADGTAVSIVDPTVMLGVAGRSAEMAHLAEDARVRLERALATLPTVA